MLPTQQQPQAEIDTENYAPIDDNGNGNNKMPIKITSHICDRSFRPVFGLFYGLPGGAKMWRRVLARLSRDLTQRNCGPGFLLRQAMTEMPDALLDKPFSLELPK